MDENILEIGEPALQAIADAMPAVIIALGLLIGLLIVLIFSSGMRNST
jgi:hypothetical protein